MKLKEQLKNELLMQGYTSQIPSEIKPHVLGILDRYLYDSTNRGILKGALPFHEIEVFVKPILIHETPVFPEGRLLNELSYGGKISLHLREIGIREKSKYALLTIFHHEHQKK